MMQSAIHSVVAGAGPAVVLIPGLAGLAKFWHPLQGHIAPHFRSIAIDHPGVGLSRSLGPPSISAIAQQVLALLDREGIERAHVIGHSTGGLVAQALALDAPGRVAKLVLSNTWARADGRFRDLFRLRQHVLRNCGPAGYAALGDLLAFPPDWYEAHIAEPGSERDLAREIPMNVELTLERIDMLLEHDRADELGHIAASVCIVGAPDDNIVPFHHSQDLAKRIPRARLDSLDGGHFTPTTKTVAYAALVSTFLKDGA
ncbi:alpha/beta fold hydrolase [Variovorax sp. tm]|uniref:alpha/beta fold hydrolase n=1 Tax=Variovorax atrisoli TaxID=3394203 RepID=UPI003A7FA834